MIFPIFKLKLEEKTLLWSVMNQNLGKENSTEATKLMEYGFLVWLRTDERKLVLKIVEIRDAATVLPIIKSSVIEGSIVLTDCWRAYNRIQEELGLIHGTVNHSLNYVDPVTLNHTNTIEGTWNGIKMKVPPRKRTKKLITDELIKFQWNRVYESNKWEAFIEALRRYQIE